MELEDLVLKHFSAWIENGKMIITQDEDGNYKAPSADALLKALSINRRVRKSDNIFTRRKVGGKWYPMIRR